MTLLGSSIREETSFARKKTVLNGQKNRPERTEAHSRAVYQSFLEFPEGIPAKVNAFGGGYSQTTYPKQTRRPTSGWNCLPEGLLLRRSFNRLNSSEDPLNGLKITGMLPL